jgi:magnesium-transporting ATPase (P-type)
VSGASPYESWIYSGFNFILGLPIIFYGILDRDVAPDFALRYPQVYSTGRTNVLLNVASICQWIFNAMVYAVVVCLMSYNVLFPSFYYMGLYTAGTIVMIGLVLSLQCKVAFFHNQWSYPQINSMLFSFFAMYLYYMLIAVAVNDYYGEATMAYAEPVLWLWSLLTVPLTTIFIDWAAYFARYCLCPTQEMLFREFELQVSGAFPPLY